MSQYKIGVIIGSLRKDSFNMKLAKALIKLAPESCSFKFIDIGDLPLYNQDHDNAPSEAVKKFKGDVSAMNGIMFVTPEYNRGIPGVLKNALDTGSRPYGQSVWAGKPTGVIGASIGKIGTAVAQHELRTVLAYLDMPTMGQPEAYVFADETLFDADGNIGSTQKEFMQKWINSFVGWVTHHTS